MKIRWIFKFEYENIKFDKPSKFLVSIDKEHSHLSNVPDVYHNFQAELTIKPGTEETGKIRNRGEVDLILPGRDETKEFACSIVNSLANQITFSQGKLDINWSFVASELLPETQEEIEEVGDGPYSFTLQLETVPDKKLFDASFTHVVSNPLVVQFNNADDAKNPIDTFNGFFKILEDVYSSTPVKSRFLTSTKKNKSLIKNLKPTLKSSDDLVQIALDNLEIESEGIIRAISEHEVELLLDTLVEMRHQCSHLKRSQGFGIAYGDNRIHTEVKPLLEQLRLLAFAVVQKHAFKG